jgi:endoribonuclease Dicer
VIKTHTDFEVELYHGAKGVDEWTAPRWKKEVSKYQVSADPEIISYLVACLS